MKKVNFVNKEEIVIEDFQDMTDYIEDFYSLITDKLLDMTSGYVFGMEVTQDGSSGVLVSSGAIYMDEKIGELEGSGSGLVINLPPSGTKTDTICAYYEEVFDHLSSGWVKLDVSSAIEQVADNYDRVFGAALITVEENTPSSGVTDKIVLAEVISSSSGIVSITDKRVPIKTKGINGQTIPVEIGSTKTLKSYIDETLSVSETADFTNDLSESFTFTAVEMLPDGGILTTITLFDPHGWPYKVKVQLNSEDPIYKTITYGNDNNLSKIEG